MTYTDIVEMIKSMGLPWDYYQFDDDTAVAPPYLVYFFTANNDQYADNSNYQKIETLTIELYSDEKDYEDEAVIEAVLTNAGLTFTKAENWIDTERMYQEVYQADVLIVAEDISE